MIFAILSFVFALLGAMDLDEAMKDIVETGEYKDFYYYEPYWTYTGNFANEEETLDYLAGAALIFLYGKAGWSKATLANNQEIISNSLGVSAICGEWGADNFGIYGVDMDSILERFKNEEFRILDEATQKTKIWEYMYRRFNPDDD